MMFWDDVADDFDHWVHLLEQLSGYSFINFEQDVWEMAREYKEPPHIGDIRQHLLLERLRQTIEERYWFLWNIALMRWIHTYMSTDTALQPYPILTER